MHEVKTSSNNVFKIKVQKSKPILMCLHEHLQRSRLSLRHSYDAIGFFAQKSFKTKKNQREMIASPEKQV